RLQVFPGTADRQIGRRIAALLEELEMAVGVSGLAFGRGAEHRRHVVLTLHVGLRRKIQIAAIRLRFACESRLEVLVRLGSSALHGPLLRLARSSPHCPARASTGGAMNTF